MARTKQKARNNGMRKVKKSAKQQAPQNQILCNDEAEKSTTKHTQDMKSNSPNYSKHHEEKYKEERETKKSMNVKKRKTEDQDGENDEDQENNWKEKEVVVMEEKEEKEGKEDEEDMAGETKEADIGNMTLGNVSIPKQNEMELEGDDEAQERLKSSEIRLAMLKRKLEDARKLNTKEVTNEEKRSKTKQDTEKDQKQQKVELKKRQKEILAEAKASGNIFIDKSIFEQTAEDAQQIQQEKSEKQPAAYGQAIHTEENIFRAYEKRLKKLPIGNGKNHGGIEKMVSELEETQKRRENFQRRRPYVESKANISYINERNRKFNDKLDRYFGEHTKELKENLERGTALPK